MTARRRTTAKRSLSRQLGDRSYHKRFVIISEGRNTEVQYFAMLKAYNPAILIRCGRGKHSAPWYVLKKIQDISKDYDEAWIVVDKDDWTIDQLDDLLGWIKEEENRFLALSNPKFEFWLLLHFETGSGISSSDDCTLRLRRHLPNFDKNLSTRDFTQDKVISAIDRARQRDNPPCTDWPKACGTTTVYRLVERIVPSVANER